MRYLLILFAIFLYAAPATKEDVNEIKKDLQIIIKKIDELDKRVYKNSVKIDALEKVMNKRFELIDKRFEEMKESFNKRFELIDKRFEDINKRFEDINKRFEDMNKRFEDINRRFEDTNRRFDDMLNYLWMISAAFLGLTAVSIGFAVWDRKSTIKAAKDEIVKEIKEEKLKEFVIELKKLAKRDEELAKILRSFHLM